MLKIPLLEHEGGIFCFNYSEIFRMEFRELEHTKQMASLIPGSTLIIMPNLSHFAMWQNPAAFNAAVLKFLDMK